MTTIAPTKTPSLYSLTLEGQEIDGELAIAYDLLASDDPEERQQAEDLISSVLERAAANNDLYIAKANGICHALETMRGRAAHLRQTAAERIAKAEAEEKSIEALTSYLTRSLTARHPGQKSFKLPEYTVASHSSEPVRLDREIDPELGDDVPAEYRRTTVTLKFPAGTDPATIGGIINHITMETSAVVGVQVKSEADKPAIKSAIKAGATVPGARLEKRVNWSIK